MLRILALLALAGGLVVTAGCGSDSESSRAGETTVTTASEEAGEEESTPEQALAEIATIRSLLDDAVAQYQSGDHQAAADAVGDIYLEHYEKVEGPLGDVDHDLMEEIEEKLSTDLRTSMEDGAPQSEIDALVAEIQSDLEKAQGTLG